ncbi:MAG: PTS sugar transporter subunit IIA [Deltaproteobacteria bacterium]|nr:PTS sugar transporter subunit IIA [Deltaproteobacteria bacterium]
MALIIMAMATSMLSGPLMRLGLGTKRKSRLQDALSSKLFVPDLQAQTRRHAIEALAASAAEVEGLDPQAVTAAAWSREEAMGTGIGNGVAIPHARIPALNEPRIVVGISAAGLDFDAPDDIPAHVIFLILTPQNDPCAHLDIVSGIARLFRDRSMLDRFLTVGSFTDFLALVQTGVQWKR